MNTISISLPCTKQQVDEWVLQSGGQEKFVQLLSQFIETTHKPLPMPAMDDEACQEDFKNLCSCDCNSLWKIGKWNTKFVYECVEDIDDIYVDSKTIGSLASRKFTISERVKTDHQAIPGLQRAWQTPKSRQSVLRALFSNKGMLKNGINDVVLFKALRARKYLPAQFRPTAAKCIFQHFGSQRVLDFSAGWGDRLVAALSCQPQVQSYTAVDPNIILHQKYQEAINFYASQNNSMQLVSIAQPAECVDYSQYGTFDLIFTSPPYFNAELYDRNSATQSHNKFKTPQGWLDGFLFETLRRVIPRLESGGHLVLNISDIFGSEMETNEDTQRGKKRKRVSIIDPLVSFVKNNYSNMHFIGMVGLRMAKFYGQRVSRPEGIYAEPILIWKKQ